MSNLSALRVDSSVHTSGGMACLDILEDYYSPSTVNGARHSITRKAESTGVSQIRNHNHHKRRATFKLRLFSASNFVHNI